MLTRAEMQSRLLPLIALPLWVLAIALLVAFCYFASSLCITVLFASFLAIVVDPLITYLERWRIPRIVSSAVVIVATVLLVVAAIYASHEQVSDALDNLPQYARRIGHAIAPVTKKLQKVQDSAGTLSAESPSRRVPEVKLKSEYPDWTTYVIRGVGPISGAALIIGAIPFLMFFILIQKAHLKQKLLLVSGEAMDVSLFTANVTRMVRAFAIGNLVIGAVMSAITVGVLYLLKVQSAVLLGIVSGFLNLVPFVGALFAAFVPSVAALFQGQSLGSVGIILVTVVSLHTFTANFLIPRIIGRRVSVSPVAAMIGILFWGWLWGLIGVLLAVPLTALVKIVADSHPLLDKIANLLAERPHAIPSWTSERET